MIIKHKLRHPKTDKLIKNVYINGKGLFSWNNVYHVYNNDKNNDQLTSKDIWRINYSKSE